MFSAFISPVPTENIATVKNGACVIEGMSKTRNDLINGNKEIFTERSGYTYHEIGNGSICIQLAQPFMLSTMRKCKCYVKLWGCGAVSQATMLGFILLFLFRCEYILYKKAKGHLCITFYSNEGNL